MAFGSPSRRSWYLLIVLAALTWCLLLVERPPKVVARPPTPPAAQLGLASYYGPGFDGRETASGEIFDQSEMVAAHRTLPLGTVVRVTNLRNNRAVTLRVIDRGPYGRSVRHGTVIDVSKGAARRLRFIDAGLTRVRIEVVRKATN